MATVAAAVMRPARERRPSDQFKIKAGYMLTFDQLSTQTEVAERAIVRKAVRRNINRNQGCTALPLTIAFMVFYAIAWFLHEDISNVFFMESELRDTIGGGLEEVETIPALWDWIMDGEGFFGTFFAQTDMYDEPLSQYGGPGDKWGDWGRVLTYNQIQGLIRFECSREVSKNFFRKNMIDPYFGKTTPPYMSDLNKTQEGFRPVRDMMNLEYVRRLNEESAAERRLRLTTTAMRSSLPSRDKEENDRYRFWLYPHETTDENGLHPTLERLKWFRQKQWLDEDTKSMVITMYLLNVDLGRPRLVEVQMVFGFSRAGGIFYEVDLETMMLKMFPNFFSMAADGIWFILLIITTIWRWRHLWRAFVKGHFLDHILTFFNIIEWIIILAGWFNVYAFFRMTRLTWQLKDALEAVRQLRWFAGDLGTYREKTLDLYEVASKVSFELGWLRVICAQYCLVLMFRFFISFSAQPRLALVFNTLKAVVPDLIHFAIVFLPTFMAYVISGNLIFGRRMANFSTVQESFSTCFRIIMECEYDWDTLASEFYWTTGIWIWSFIVFIVLLMLNMVLAIVLDTYNDVRTASQSSEMVWTTVYHLWQRAMQMKTWVPDMQLEEHLTLDLTSPMVSRADFKTGFPDMPDAELDLLYENCSKDMEWEANKYLDKTTSLKMSGAVHLTADKLNRMVSTMAMETDPLHGYTNAGRSEQKGKRAVNKEGLFLTSQAKLKGNKSARVTTPGMVPSYMPPPDDEKAPGWLKETAELLTRQKKWMLYVNSELSNLQWQIQMSHMRKKDDSVGKAL
mmetsp:Transcript_117355/g.203933  ORF Transcript_117355/g.203933 Transcript_117355/m.203933 type:complete len:794 (-) Transcript_117355:195-2576(-)